MRYFDFEELKCKMCKDSIEGCNKCINEDINSPNCVVCDAGLYPTFNFKKCTKCENLWDVYDPELDKCIPCSEYFPFCGRCEINDGEFVCHECLGSTKFLEPVDELIGTIACGCEDV